MITELIYDYIKSHIRVPMSTFVINNNIGIQTNDRNLQKNLKNFLEPYFLVENKSQTKSKIKINVYTLDELQMINLLTNLKGGRETHQAIGSNNRVINWSTLDEKDYTVSYNKNFRTIVLQNNKNPNYLIIVSSETFVFRITRKIIREEIIYKEIQNKKMIPLNSLVFVSEDSEGVAVFRDSKSCDSVLIDFIKKRRLACVSLGKAYFTSTDHDFTISGTPEPIKLKSSLIENHNEFKQLFIRKNELTRRQYTNQDKTFFIGPKQLTKCISASLIPNTKLRKIIFVRDGEETSTLNRLNSIEVNKRLKMSYPGGSSNLETPWKPIGDWDPRCSIRKVIDEIASDIPAYEHSYDELLDSKLL
jgi:hypothetical protein